MKVAVIGTGYVGLVTGTCFAEMGNEVTCVDIDGEKIKRLNEGVIPIYEPGLRELIKNSISKTLFFSTNINKAIEEANMIFIAVGTPMKKDGSADLSAVFNVAEIIGEMINSHKIIVSKSTVPVGTTIKIKEIIQLKLKKRDNNIKFDIASNPEFLKEGAAIADFMKPDRVVIGAESDIVFEEMKKLYGPFFRTHDRFFTMDIASAEMTKYAANAMLATKISFINEIANICEIVGADINKIRTGIGSDSRIGYDFIYPGVGYGGTCFPKDIAALIQIGKKNGYVPELIASVEKVNENQKKIFFKKIITRFGEDFSDMTFAIWGLSFKPETNDIREAVSVFVIKELLKRKAKVKVYDPKAIEEIKKKFSEEEENKLIYGESKYEILKDSDSLILLTEWKEFRSPDFVEIKRLLNNPIIFDGRNQYKDFDMENQGFEYYQIGVGKK